MILNYKKFLESIIINKLIESNGIPDELKEINSELNIFMTKYIKDLLNNNKYNKFISKSIILKLNKNYPIIGDKLNLHINFNNNNVFDTHNTNSIVLSDTLDTKIPTLNFNFNINLLSNFNSIQVENYVSSIIHELHHAFEILIIFKNLEKSLEKSEIDIDLQLPKSIEYAEILHDYKYQLEDIYYMLYVSFNHEINARISQMFTLMEKIKSNNVDNYIKFIKNSTIWKLSDELYNFNTYDNIKHLDINKQLEIINIINNTFKFLNVKSINKGQIIDWCKGKDNYFKKISKKYKQKLLKLINEFI